MIILLRLIVRTLCYFILDILLSLLDFLHILNINERIHRSIISFNSFDFLFFLDIYDLECIDNKVEFHFLFFVYYAFNFRYRMKHTTKYSINVVLIMSELRNLFVRLQINNKFKYSDDCYSLKI